MSEDIKRYKKLVESSMMEAPATHPMDPAEAAEMIVHMFGHSSDVDKHTLKDVIHGHHNDPNWAAQVVDHLAQSIH
jgi:hypothetical protein